jgi:hypothetical protein
MLTVAVLEFNSVKSKINTTMMISTIIVG